MGLKQGMTDAEALLNEIANCLRDQCFSDSAALRVDQTTSGDVSTTYLGFAIAGSDPDANVWVIAKVIQDDDGSGNVTTVKSWAETTSGASDWLVRNKSFTDRATYTYVFDTP